MKKLAIAVTAVAAFTGSAIAADMPVKAPAAPMVRAMSWTGCYVGAGGGYGMWNQENTQVVEATGAAVSPTDTFGGRGWFGTVQGGCDYQFNSNWVVGAFADWDFGSLKGTIGDNNFSGEEKENWSWAAGGRVGYIVFPKLLAYFSGGYTQAHFDQINFSFPNGNPASYILGHTYDGWFLGSGYEYGLSFLPGLFWKTEYRFAEYGTDRNTVYFAGTSTPTGFAAEQKKYIQTIRSELVYRFNLWN